MKINLTRVCINQSFQSRLKAFKNDFFLKMLRTVLIRIIYNKLHLIRYFFTNKFRINLLKTNIDCVQETETTTNQFIFSLIIQFNLHTPFLLIMLQTFIKSVKFICIYLSFSRKMIRQPNKPKLIPSFTMPPSTLKLWTSVF